MPNLTELKDQLTDLSSMRFITSALTEASAGRLKKIRDSFERNIKMYRDISHIYHLVRISNIKQNVKGKINLPDLQLKTASVAMTSNQRFYGNINTNIMKVFVKNTLRDNSDLFVIGHVGQSFIKAVSFGKKFENISFAKDIPTVDEATAFIEKTSAYDQIFLYYPKFVSLVNQTVSVTDITQTKTDEDNKEDDEIKVLFEPELIKILEFFNRQVRTLLFVRIMLETDLSMTAARLLAMSAAEERSGDLIKEKQVEIRKTRSSFLNTQLLETFSSITQWDKGEE